jgi:hypothetical protein
LKIQALAFAASAFCCLAVPALAHHSFAMFDHEKSTMISGTVKEFEWANPHCWIHIVAVDEKSGRLADWSFEMGSVAQIAAQGWKRDSVKPGDKITITMHPLKDGSRGGQYLNATLADGHSFQQQPNAAGDNVIR